MKLTTIGLSFLMTSTLACGKTKEEAPPKSGEKSSASKPAKENSDPAVWKDLPVPKLGLVAHAPGDAKVDKMGGITGMKYKCTAMLSEKGDMTPPYDNVLKNIQGSNHGGFDAMVKNEKTDDDNFAIEWTTKGGKFGFSSRRTIGDKVISCTRVSRDKDGHDCVVKVCESLKAQ